MKVTITTLTDIILTLDVSPDMELDNFKALCECEAGIPSQEIVVMHEGLPLLDDKKDLKTYGIKEGDVLLLQQFLPQRLPLEGEQSTSQTGKEDDPEYIGEMLLGNPEHLSLLKQNNPKLAEALLSGNKGRRHYILGGITSNKALTENDRERDTLRDGAALPSPLAGCSAVGLPTDYLAKTENKWIGVNADRNIMDLAATKIQALYRGYNTRSSLAQNKHLNETDAANIICRGCKKIFKTKKKFYSHREITAQFVNSVNLHITQILRKIGSEEYVRAHEAIKSLLQDAFKCTAVICKIIHKKPAFIASTIFYLFGKLVEDQHTLKEICSVYDSKPGDVFKLSEVIRKQMKIFKMPSPHDYLKVWCQKLAISDDEQCLAKTLVSKIMACSVYDRYAPISVGACALHLAAKNIQIADIASTTGVSTATLQSLTKRFQLLVEVVIMERGSSVHANDESSSISGYLHKKSGQGWQKNWFVVKYKVLYEYRAREDVVALRSVPLLGYMIETFSEAIEEIEPGLLFQLTHPGQAAIVFHAETLGSTERWIQALKEATVLE